MRSNRKGRRLLAFNAKPKRVMERGTQDSSEITHRDYLIKSTRKSRAGIEYTYYKRVRDIIGLDKK